MRKFKLIATVLLLVMLAMIFLTSCAEELEPLSEEEVFVMEFMYAFQNHNFLDMMRMTAGSRDYIRDFVAIIAIHDFEIIRRMEHQDYASITHNRSEDADDERWRQSASVQRILHRWSYELNEEEGELHRQWDEVEYTSTQQVFRSRYPQTFYMFFLEVEYSHFIRGRQTSVATIQVSRNSRGELRVFDVVGMR